MTHDLLNISNYSNYNHRRDLLNVIIFSEAYESAYPQFQETILSHLRPNVEYRMILKIFYNRKPDDVISIFFNLGVIIYILILATDLSPITTFLNTLIRERSMSSCVLLLITVSLIFYMARQSIR